VVANAFNIIDKKVALSRRSRAGPVIQLQTAFGGGKTQAMLAVYHLARRACPPHLAGIAASTTVDLAHSIM